VGSVNASGKSVTRNEDRNDNGDREIRIYYEKDDKEIPLIRKGGAANNDDELDSGEEGGRYLEPVQRFPIPADDPILKTAAKQRLTNIRTNPHYKLSQV
jgi:hypothetical protein